MDTLKDVVNLTDMLYRDTLFNAFIKEFFQSLIGEGFYHRFFVTFKVPFVKRHIILDGETFNPNIAFSPTEGHGGVVFKSSSAGK
ncbi:MAG: hypothetical protein GY849_16815 [Deltaproteobacteria bacterium]|nr:hypothetical protein [Deltaproteobacteria bacterium]